MPLLIDAIVKFLTNLVLLFGLPFGFYVAYHRLRHRRAFREIAKRAGLEVGERRYIVWSLVFAVGLVFLFLLWSPPLAPFLGDHSPQKPFEGLGLSGVAIAMALIYGMGTTGFTEEFLFRGLIAGSLSRRLPLPWANLIQSLIFLAPHVAIVIFLPELWPILPIIFVTALFKGWVRIASGSIVGPWLIHGMLNVATCLMVAIRTVN